MTAAGDEQFARGIEFCASVATVGGKLANAVSTSSCATALAVRPQARGISGDTEREVHEKLAFNFQDAFVGSKDLAFIFLSSVEVKRSALTRVCFRS